MALKSILKVTNILKCWFTSILGVLILLGTCYMIFFNNMEWVWEGIAGISIGTVLLFAPKTLERRFIEIIGNIAGKNINSSLEEGEVNKEK